jgi:hypothetical protein
MVAWSETEGRKEDVAEISLTNENIPQPLFIDLGLLHQLECRKVSVDVD